MSHLDFFIRKEHKFIKTILGEDEVKQSAALKSVSNYIEVFLKFTKVFILLENNIQRLTDFEDIVEQYLKNFYQNNCRKFDTFPEILEEVKKFEVKRIGKTRRNRKICPLRLCRMETKATHVPKKLMRLCLGRNSNCFILNT